MYKRIMRISKAVNYSTDFDESRANRLGRTRGVSLWAIFHFVVVRQTKLGN